MVSYTGVTSRKSPFPDAKDTTPLCTPCMSLNYNFIWLLCYLLVLVGLAGYGFHRLSIVYLYWKNRNNKPQPKARFQELPVVTVQLPMFNEKFVVDRLLESVAALDYPQDKLEIQILDDSTDDTTEQCYRKVEELKSRGFRRRLHPPHGPHRLQGRRAGSGYQSSEGGIPADSGC